MTAPPLATIFIFIFGHTFYGLHGGARFSERGRYVTFSMGLLLR